MKKFLVLMVLTATLCVFAATEARATSFILGDESSGATLKADDIGKIKFRIRLQPRVDMGDLSTPTPASYESTKDMYIRRAYLETSGDLTDKLSFKFTLASEKWGKAKGGFTVKLHEAYLKYKLMPEHILLVGKHDLPMTRIASTSSTKQLLIERPAAIEDGKKIFGASDKYEQFQFMLTGSAMDGLIGYAVAVADGWQSGEKLPSGGTVSTSGLLMVARVTAALPGWEEKGQKDSHLGEGRHLVVGASYASEGSIDYVTTGSEDRLLSGFDVSGHMGPFTGQFEYIRWDIDSSDAAVTDVEALGYYLQGGYYIKGYNLEPAFRYAVYDNNSKLNDMTETETTIGVNYYLKGNSFKVSANWVHTDFDDNVREATLESDKDVYQFQAQLYF